MSNYTESQNAACAPECAPCAGKQALTDTESWILQEMRAIKETVRPVAQRLDGLEKRIKDPIINITEEKKNAEWARLESRMAELRREWSKWEERLDEAIDHKLILLGHRTQD